MLSRRQWLGSFAACALMPRIGHATTKVLARYPHDPNAFTQGLLFHQGLMYESTGLYGRSSLRKVEWRTGRVLQQHNLPDHLFGEGLARVGQRLIQLTWRRGLAIEYTLADFTPQRTFRYDGEGWGLTFDGQQLWMSNGSAELQQRDPVTFALQRRLSVRHRDGRPQPLLNELEWIDGLLWANVYHTPFIVVIDPQRGEVVRSLNLAHLPRPHERYGGEDVLNGIAWDAEQRRLWVTGKLYAWLYQIEF